MTDKWFISDPHFGHENILKFTDKNGNITRPGFESVDHMNETIINNCQVIKPSHKVYFLGDLTFSSKVLDAVMPRIPGKKRLILGNHDRLRMDNYYKFFQKIDILYRFDTMEYPFVCTHIPVHESQLLRYKKDGRREAFNVHGHVHLNSLKDWRYINLCVEMTDYKPVHMDELQARMKKILQWRIKE